MIPPICVGPQGAQGAAGAQGAQGDDGAPGAQGAQGEAGAGSVVDKIDAGNAGTTQLVDLDTTLFADASLVPVYSVGRFYYLSRTPSAAVIAATDGITVVQPTTVNTHRWVMAPGAPDTRFWYVAAWFVDAAGNDDNDGLTAPTALATLAELTRRLTGATIGQATTITIAAGTYGDFRLLEAITIQNGILVTVQGNVTSSGAQALSAVTATAPATDVRGSVSVAAAPLWVDFDRLRLTSGAASGAIAYVTRIVSGTEANVTRWAQLANLATGTTPVLTGPTAADTYVVDTLNTTIGAVVADTLDTGRLLFKDCIVSPPNSDGIRVTNMKPALDGVMFYMCRFAGTCNFFDSTYTSEICDYAVAGTATDGTQTIHACRFRQGFATAGGATVYFFSTNCWDGGDAALSAQLAVNGSHTHFGSSTNDAEFVDGICEHAVLVGSGAKLEQSLTCHFWGANNVYTQEACKVFNYAAWVYTTLPHIPGGTGSDCDIGGVQILYAGLPLFNATNGAGMTDRQV